MLTELYPQIYCNHIPLPNNPLRFLNSYIIRGADRNLIIDTGFNQPECEAAFFNGIDALHLDLNKTDILLTHCHSDHTGLASLLEQKGAAIYAGKKEGRAIQAMSDPATWSFMDTLTTRYGLNQYGITANDHPGYRFRPQPLQHYHPLSEGDKLQYGPYTFSVIDIPGHTPGHIGLYEAQHRLFFCGDHILASITPNITHWSSEPDSLALYLASLRKVYALEIDWLFTAHREIVRDHRSRIDHLIIHHEVRLAEIRQILAANTMTAAQVAAAMKWEIRAKSWEDFPKAQKWFATGEAAAHLDYLYHAGAVVRSEASGTLYYRLPA